MKTIIKNNVPGFTKVTIQKHTREENGMNLLAAALRGAVNLLRLDELVRRMKEGGSGISHDLRSGQR